MAGVSDLAGSPKSGADLYFGQDPNRNPKSKTGFGFESFQESGGPSRAQIPISRLLKASIEPKVGKMATLIA